MARHGCSQNRESVAKSSSKNILLIAAAGNTPVTTAFYPAAYQGVMAVTAVDNNQLASYANRGSFVTLGTPGTSGSAVSGLSEVTARLPVKRSRPRRTPRTDRSRTRAALPEPFDGRGRCSRPPLQISGSSRPGLGALV